MKSVRDGTAADSGRLGLETVLQRALREARADATAFASIGIGAPSAKLDASLRAVFSLRAQAVATLASGVDAAIGAPGRPRDVPVATARLTNAGVQVLEADAAYARWLKGIHSLRGSPREPASRWVALARLWRPPATSLWARTLAGDPALRASETLRIVSLSLEPAAVRIEGLAPSTTAAATTTTSSTTTTSAGSTTTTRAGATTTSSTSSTTSTTLAPTTTTSQLPGPHTVSVLPPTGTLAVVAVVADSGNVAVTGVVVTAAINGSSPGRTRTSPRIVVAATRTRRLGPLGPGGARYMTLHAARVHLGGSYVVTVTVSAPGVTTVTDTVHVRVANA